MHFCSVCCQWIPFHFEHLTCITDGQWLCQQNHANAHQAEPTCRFWHPKCAEIDLFIWWSTCSAAAMSIKRTMGGVDGCWWFCVGRSGDSSCSLAEGVSLSDGKCGSTLRVCVCASVTRSTAVGQDWRASRKWPITCAWGFNPMCVASSQHLGSSTGLKPSWRLLRSIILCETSS